MFTVVHDTIGEGKVLAVYYVDEAEIDKNTCEKALSDFENTYKTVRVIQPIAINASSYFDKLS